MADSPAQQAADGPDRLRRGVGHLHAHRAAGRRQRTHQRPAAPVVTLPLQLDGRVWRSHVKALSGTERRSLDPAAGARHRRHGERFQADHRRGGRLLSGVGGYHTRTGVYLDTDHGNLSELSANRQDGDALRPFHQRHRLARAPQGAGAKLQTGRGAAPLSIRGAAATAGLADRPAPEGRQPDVPGGGHLQGQ